MTHSSASPVVHVERQSDETQRQHAVRRRPRDDVISVLHMRVISCAQVHLEARDLNG